MATGNDAQAILVEVHSARDRDRLCGHRVQMTVMGHHAGGPDEHRDAQRQLLGADLQGPQSWPFLGQANGGDDAGGTRGAALVGLLQPLRQLLVQVLLVQETPLFEERAFDPSDQVLDRPFLFRARRPAQLHPDPQFQHDRREGRVPLGDLAVSPPYQRDRLGHYPNMD